MNAFLVLKYVCTWFALSIINDGKLSKGILISWYTVYIIEYGQTEILLGPSLMLVSICHCCEF